jgi:dihydrofolate reductase
MTAPVSLVLAMASNGVIGANNKIPWRIPDDMKRFKSITMGRPIVMGRKTWDSLPHKPLPGRSNIVITRHTNWKADGAAVAHSLNDAIALAEHESPSEIAVIGGAEIYKAALPRATLVHLTQVHRDFDGDVRMPPFDSSQWRETSRENGETEDGLRYSYVTLTRIWCALAS